MPANTSPMPDGEYRPVCECVWRQMHSRLGADSVVSGSRFGRVWEQIWSRLGRCSLTSTEFVLSVYRICFSALPILKVNSISIKHRRWGMTPSLLCSWDDRIKKDCLSTLDRQSFRVYIAMRLSDGELSNVEKITSAILLLARIFYILPCLFGSFRTYSQSQCSHCSFE